MCGDSANLEGFQCPMKRFQCNSWHTFGHYTSICYQRIQQKQAPYKSRKPKAHQLKVGTIYVQDSTICVQSEDSSSDDSFWLQIKVQCTHASVKSTPTHCTAYLITNWTYWLKLHQTRNLYLRTRLDTGADINIMPASVYRLVLKDPKLRKVIPSKLEIGTYTNDTVKLLMFANYTWSTWTVKS